MRINEGTTFPQKNKVTDIPFYTLAIKVPLLSNLFLFAVEHPLLPFTANEWKHKKKKKHNRLANRFVNFIL